MLKEYGITSCDLCIMELNEITFLIRKALFAVHNYFGPGLFESIYKNGLVVELRSLGLTVEKEVSLPVAYKNVDLGLSFRLDLLVEEEVIIEVKSIETLLDVHKKQLLTYLRLINCPVGLLVNFNSVSLIDKVSLIRIANQKPPSTKPG